MSVYPVPSRLSLKVTKINERSTIDANWDKPMWQTVPSISLDHYMGETPVHFPRTCAKLVYDDDAIYVIFRVEDRYVRAVAPRHQSAVCKDSCAEFFFSPGPDISAGYFNLEMNCGGTMLFHFQTKPREGIEITKSDLVKIEVAHTLPNIVEPEIGKPTTWVVEYRIPTAILENYCKLSTPGPGAKWRGNLYKCGDGTSHPHWLTWSAVENATPDFHLPDFFGDIDFE